MSSEGTPFYGLAWTDPRTGKSRHTWWAPEQADPRRARRSSRGGGSRGRSRSSPAHDPVSAWQPGVSSPQHFSWNQNGFPVDAWLTTDFRGVTELAVRVRVRDGYQRLAEPYRGSLSSVHSAAKVLAQKIIAKAAVSNDPSKHRRGKRKKSGARRARSAQRKGHPTDLVVLMKGAGFPQARAHAERLKTISRRTTVKPIVGDYRGLGSDSRETDAEPGFGRRRRDNRWPDGRYYWSKP
jgi:hypothetical protein